MLSDNEKEILGNMTDEGIVVGELRKQIKADDEFAREQILNYVYKTLPDKQKLQKELQDAADTISTTIDLFSSYLQENQKLNAKKS